MTPHEREIPGPGQESVWDYPRPPALRRCEKRVRILLRGELLADTTGALCVLETSHPPTYYLPPYDIDMRYLREVRRIGFTDVVKRTTPGASALRAADFRRWAPVLRRELEAHRPRQVPKRIALRIHNVLVQARDHG